MNDKIFSEVVEDCIQKFMENTMPYVYNHLTGEQIDICRIASENHFLPIFYDWTAFCSIRPNGEMVWCEYENPEKLEVEKNERMRNIAMMKGIELFPELSAFSSQRKPDDIDCSYCESTNKMREQMREDLRDSLNCYCGGLGWIPKNGL